MVDFWGKMKAPQAKPIRVCKIQLKRPTVVTDPQTGLGRDVEPGAVVYCEEVDARLLAEHGKAVILTVPQLLR